MMMRLIFFVLIGLLTFAEVGPALAQAQVGDRVQVAQQAEPKRRTLFDLLFGETPAPPAPVQQTQPRQSAPVASLPPPKPTIDKAADATRLAVFGDSLAIDLSRALERFYAEDPNLIVLGQGVSSSGFVRDDYFDWNNALARQIAADSFDIAVIIIGINDRQEIRANGQTYPALSEGWVSAYQGRLNQFLAQLRAAGKPAIWLGLPPMSRSEYSAAISQISALHKMAAFSAGAEFLDIYDRFVGEDGRYSAYGPDVNGLNALMRKDDGIHFANAGSDKLAFYISQAIRGVYRGGAISVAIADPLSGTDAVAMMRPPYQGLGQIRLLEVAGAVLPLSRAPQRADDLLMINNGPASGPGFTLEQLMQAPQGRVDAFGVGIDPQDLSQRAAEASEGTRLVE